MKHSCSLKKIRSMMVLETKSAPKPMIKLIVVAISSLMAVSVSQADTPVGGVIRNVGDLEIYQNAKGGNINLTLMLDTSGSMSEPYMRDGSACDMGRVSYYPYSDTSSAVYTRAGCQVPVSSRLYHFRKTKAGLWYKCDGDSPIGTKTVKGVGSTNMANCTSPLTGAALVTNNNFPYTSTTSSNGDTYYSSAAFIVYDRLTRLKDAIFTLMESPAILSKADKIQMGVGQFSSQSGSDNTYTSADGKSGKIVVPAALLNEAQRNKIKAAVAKFNGGGGTPTANAYAEAAAYLLGTTTEGSITRDKELYIKANASYAYTCTAFSDSACADYNNPQVTISYLKNNGYQEVQCGLFNTLCYRKTVTDSSVKLGYSGFAKSATDTKDSTKYKSPLSTTATCDGNGIYFLTDGAPNSAPDPLLVMKPALGTYSNKFTGLTSPSLVSGSESQNSMPEVGEFSKLLRDSRTNPSGSSIRTAVVGFGSIFDLSAYSGVKTQPLRRPKLDPITKLPMRDASGNPVYEDPINGLMPSEVYYDCSKITNTDAKNACQWGAKSHPLLPAGVGGFGEGGFTSAQSTQDVVDSVVNFVSALDTTIPATPSGTLVVPDDPYNAASQLAVAYYPSVQAEVAKNPAIWTGNMKKYNLDNGSLFGLNKDNQNAKLFLNDLGIAANSTDTTRNTGTGSSGALNPAVRDLWASQDSPDANNLVGAGGYVSNLPVPTTLTTTASATSTVTTGGVGNVRTLYVEDFKSTTDTTPILRKFGVNSSGKVVLDGKLLSASNKFFDTTTYTESTLRNLLQFLGFNNLPETGNVDTLTLQPTTTAIKIAGATIHSTPASVSYSATLNEDGSVSSTRDDYVLFGSTEGGLHLVNADSYTASGDGGKEHFVIIPKAMLKPEMQQALVSGGTSAKGIGQPYFGIDAPWLVSATYTYDSANRRVTVCSPITPPSSTTSATSTTASTSTATCGTDGGIFAYGGMRMGGEGLYGMDLTDKSNPKMMFKLDSTTPGFSRMGQIWSKPVKTKIKTSLTDKGTDVLIFGGGYDIKYENPSYVPDSKDLPKGNALYIVNAKTGSLIWSATNVANTVVQDATNTTNEYLTNSIVAEVTPLDRNGDGFMDNLYFADLGGQVFRADFTNANDYTYTVSGTGTATTIQGNPQTAFSNYRITRILSNTPNSNLVGPYTLRFYERPVASLHEEGNKRFMEINIISGDRSSPLSRTRNSTALADRVYGILDRDVTLPNTTLYASDFNSNNTTTTRKQAIVDLTDDNMQRLPLDMGTTAATRRAAIDGAKAAMNPTVSNNATKYGWYYPLTRFDGFTNVLYGKGMGKLEVIGGYLYTTVYNPDMTYDLGSSCNAKIVGGSERELYCMPYGICDNYNAQTGTGSLSGTGGFSRAGRGIQELALGPISSSKGNKRVLIGVETIFERSAPRFGYGNDSNKTTASATTIGLDRTKNPNIVQDGGSVTSDGGGGLGDGSEPTLTLEDNYKLIPNTWYEVTK